MPLMLRRFHFGECLASTRVIPHFDITAASDGALTAREMPASLVDDYD